MDQTAAWLQPLPAPDMNAAEAARRRQAVLTKPPGSLGRLEMLAIELAGQQGRERPSVERVRITVFAADHGVCAEGVSAFPQSVTTQMVHNFAAGGAAISVLARCTGATLEVVDVGTVSPPGPLPGVLDARIAPGTDNLAVAPAMTAAQLAQALQAGEDAAVRAAADDMDLFIGGEMGIGNTTSAAAVACALLSAAPASLVGRGTGVDDAGLARKRDAVARGLARHGSNQDPLAVLGSLGGFEIAALAGAMLGCARRRIPVLVDGSIVSVAALAAVRLKPELSAWLHFSHLSEEAGHRLVLEALDAQPLLNLGMRLGEGSGAAIALPLLQAACRLHSGMASFEEAGVADGG